MFGDGGWIVEVDEAVAHVSMPRVKHSLVIGKNGVTIRRISADTNVRIYVPGKKEEPAPNEIQVGITHTPQACLAPNYYCCRKTYIHIHMERTRYRSFVFKYLL